MALYVVPDIGAVQDEAYVFRGIDGFRRWPMIDGQCLGAAGAWNCLWRLGFTPRLHDIDALPSPVPGDVLFASSVGPLDGRATASIGGWLQRGGAIVATGAPEAWALLLGASDSIGRAHFENPYAALAYAMDSAAPEIVAPPRWSYLTCAPHDAGASRPVGALVAVHGERQTPSRALVTRITDAPAVLQAGRLSYLNGRPFAAFQAWLQGQEDLNPWLSWRHRLFWLDEAAAFLGRVLGRLGVISEATERPGIPGLGPTTVVLRHDLDGSRDTAYLDEETKRGLVATHAILRDRNTSFWVERLRAHAGHEAAFHYDTATDGPAAVLRRMVARRASPRPWRPRRHARALVEQVRWALGRGVGIATLHRHWSFLVYPEWIDAMDGVLEREAPVLGGSSLFRAQVLRWGTDRVDGARGSVGDWPDAQFPLWLPFKLSHAARGGRLLRGWESTSMMEVEPALLAQLLDHHVPGLPQRVVTVNFHPAHAAGTTFNEGGSLNAFRRALDVIAERDLAVMTLSEAYRRSSEAIGE